MCELELEEIRNIQLEILKKVAGFCDERGLRYFLYHGTLIGAIRHKGYIPWDDDIDIAMPRPDYEKFINTFNGYDENLTVYDCTQNNEYNYLVAKVSYKNSLLLEYTNISFSNMGINIDIYPLDGLPESRNIKKRLLRKIKLKRSVYTIKSVKIRPARPFYKNVILFLGQKVLSFLDFNSIVLSITKDARSAGFEDSKEVGCLVWGYGVREIMEKYYYDNHVDVEFEGYLFKAPAEYDKVLSRLYGDYMQLPPTEKQITHHDFVAYMK